MLTKNIILAAFVLIIFISNAAHLQEQSDGDVERVKPAPLLRVDQGLFAIRIGQSIDLSDRHLLLTLREGTGCLEIRIKGREACIEAGEHFDLTHEHAPFHLGDLFKDKKRCFLDVVKVEHPKGAPAIVTFRFYCA